MLYFQWKYENQYIIQAKGSKQSDTSASTHESERIDHTWQVQDKGKMVWD